MPDETDVKALQDFLSQSLATYSLIVERGRLRRADQRALVPGAGVGIRCQELVDDGLIESEPVGMP